MPRTRLAAPTRLACSVKTSMCWPDTCASSGAMRQRNSLRMKPINSSVSVRGSRPMLIACATIVRARPGSRSIIASTNSSSGTVSSPASPTVAASSRADSASRAEPAPWRSTCSTAASLTSRPASAATHRTCSLSVSVFSRWNCRCWVRLRIVSDIFCGSVVASTNTTCGGGSSSVFSSAASAGLDNMCTSSRMYTLCRPGVPSDAFSIRSRMASTPLLLAASSSWTS